MLRILDLGKDWEKLDHHEIGESKLDPTSRGADWARQDDMIFCWSASNLRYEYAWWLYGPEDCDMIRRLREERSPPEGTII